MPLERAVVALFLSLLARPGAAQGRPEVTFYAEQRGMSFGLFMIFDPRDSGVLCRKPTEVVTLKVQSESVTPWTMLVDGQFMVAEKGGEKAAYGRYFLADIVADGETRTVGAFRRAGEGERALGCTPDGGGIYVTDDGKGRRIGDWQFMNVTTASGKWTVRAHRLSPGKAWVAQVDDQIVEIGPAGKTRQVGWVGWRKIAIPSGETLILLMTKGMGQSARWAGRHGGKLYRDAR